MTFLQSSLRAWSPDDPLWLVVGRDGKRVRCFELRPNVHRAIAFGSSKDADLRVDGVPPIAFFVEREEGNVWLTPAYADSDLRVDARPLVARRQLTRSSIIDCATARLELIVRDTPPTLRGSEISLGPSDDANLDEVFKELERGRDGVAIQKLSYSNVPAGLRDPVTTEYDRNDLVPPEAFPTQTLKMLRTDFEHLFESCGAGQTHHDEAGRTVEFRHGLTGAVLQEQCDRPMDLLTPELPERTLLGKLGILTRARPLAVLAGAAFGAVVMAFFLVGVSTVISGRSDARWHAAPPRTEVSTETHERVASPDSSRAPVEAEIAESVDEVPVQADAAVTPAAPRTTPRRAKHLRR